MEDKVYELLDVLNIKYTKIKHPPLFTGKDNEKYDIKFDAQVCKNLFIRNKNKNQYYLYALPLNKKANFKLLQEKLGETRLSFGDEDVLKQKLGVKSGSVSIFNIVNLIIFLSITPYIKYWNIIM